MNRPAAGLALLLAFSPLAALAQPAPGLVYSQPLPPAALQQVQEKLRAAGAYQGRADGVWGPESQQALERYQQRNGLQVTGQLNQATAATLGLQPAELLTGATSGGGMPASSADPLAPEVVRNVQRQLRRLGFYRGGADGVWGPGTQAAIERFQQGRALQPTGQLNPATAQAMGLDPNNLAAPVR
jgi:peptidoglycan hydrolase-like protein with peptidoglycan-binding domain